MSSYNSIGDLVRAKHPSEWSKQDIIDVVDATAFRLSLDSDDAHSRGIRTGCREGLMLALELVAIAADHMPEKP